MVAEIVFFVILKCAFAFFVVKGFIIIALSVTVLLLCGFPIACFMQTWVRVPFIKYYPKMLSL